MAERWNRPVVPIALEATDQVVELADGRTLVQYAPALSAEDIERARAGYICLKCLQWFEEAWPEKCFVCGARIRRDQALYFAREFGGVVDLGPRTSLEEESAGMEERRRKEEEE